MNEAAIQKVIDDYEEKLRIERARVLGWKAHAMRLEDAIRRQAKALAAEIGE